MSEQIKYMAHSGWRGGGGGEKGKRWGPKCWPTEFSLVGGTACLCV